MAANESVRARKGENLSNVTAQGLRTQADPDSSHDAVILCFTRTKRKQSLCNRPCLDKTASQHQALSRGRFTRRTAASPICISVYLDAARRQSFLAEHNVRPRARKQRYSRINAHGQMCRVGLKRHAF